MNGLTSAQKALLRSDLEGDHPFILLQSTGQDKVAKNLAKKGLGYFTDFKSHYSWRHRSGYFNHFTPSKEGLRIRRGLRHEDR